MKEVLPLALIVAFVLGPPLFRRSVRRANRGHARKRRRSDPRPTPQRSGPRPARRPDSPKSGELRGKCHVIDGDTIVIQGAKIRLAGIDAPELDQPWGRKAKWAMIELCKGQVVTAELNGERSYDRLVGTCYLPDGRDLAAELVNQGLALDWLYFSGGRYRYLEPVGVRRKLREVHRRQQF